jgi:tetratricopeptide (TPR) repeat protein
MESKQLQVSKIAREKAAQLCQEGLDYYAHWDIERAIEVFKSAIALNSLEADYCLYLAQSYVRLGNYEMMRKALGRFLQLNREPELTERFERLFGSSMDEVETYLTQTMTQHDVPLEVIGAAIQMWLCKSSRGDDSE